MSETLVIRLPENDDAAWEWVVVTRDGRPTMEVTSGFLVDAGSLAEHRRVVAFAPATSVLRTNIDIPLRNPNKIRQALPYALEEQLAGNVETQHFAAGRRENSGNVPVAVVAIDLLDDWLAELNQAGLRPDGIYAESDGVTPVPNTISVMIDQHRVIICDPAGEITVADPESLQAILDLHLDSFGTPQSELFDDDLIGVPESVSKDDDAGPKNDPEPINLLVYCSAEDHDAHGVLWDMLRLRTDSLEIKIMSDGSLARLAAQIIHGEGVNLLQGDYAAKSELNLHWKQWRMAAILAIVLVCLLGVYQGVSYWSLIKKEAALDSAAEQLLVDAFGGSSGGDPWGQLRSQLGNAPTEAAETGPGFDDAIETLSIAFTQTPGIKIEAMTYRAGNLDLQVIAPDVNTLDQLRQRINAPGRFSAEIQSANPEAEKIKGRMKISAIEGAS